MTIPHERSWLHVRRLDLVCLLIVASFASAADMRRFEGLDRLYFRRVTPTDAMAQSCPALLASNSPVKREDIAAPDVVVSDVVLPDAIPGAPLRIRQVVDHGHPRIERLWWALYDGGRRSDLWTFEAIPERTDGKMLTNYRLEGAEMSPGGKLILRALGEMFRPLGAWSLVGKEWEFAVDEDVIRLERVRDAFGLFRSYDTGEVPPVISVYTERRVAGVRERRSLAAVSKRQIEQCGFLDPTTSEDWAFSWEDLQRTARCFTAADDTVTEHRAPDASPFSARPVPLRN